jgi:hypothetical protein
MAARVYEDRSGDLARNRCVTGQPARILYAGLGALLPSITLVLLLTGCAGYRLGPANGMAAGSRSIRINPIPNQTLQPGLSDAVTGMLRKELQRDGAFQLATHQDTGDIVLDGTIVRYDRHELSFHSSDNLTVKDFSILITAQITARERGTGKVILDKLVTGSTMIRVGSDMTSAERQGMPLLADDLAKNVVALLSEGTW